TFYIMTRLSSDICVFLEASTIVIPKWKKDVVNIVSYLDDIFSIINLHKRIAQITTDYITLSILPFDFFQSKSKTLPRKRTPSLGSLIPISK
ncbi:hypothetical protein F4703DRAFT_1710170, partial [Phycomyces blakesleeanus]